MSAAADFGNPVILGDGGLGGIAIGITEEVSATLPGVLTAGGARDNPSFGRNEIGGIVGTGICARFSALLPPVRLIVGTGRS